MKLGLWRAHPKISYFIWIQYDGFYHFAGTLDFVQNDLQFEGESEVKSFVDSVTEMLSLNMGLNYKDKLYLIK